ncbi:MAG: hypothetical protein ACT4NV_08445 [Rhodoferax sp.]
MEPLPTPAHDPDDRRAQPRCDLVSIRLRLRLPGSGQWAVVHARGWNVIGFNFRCGYELPLGEYTFARGTARFAGTLVWQADHNDMAELEHALVNQWLFEKARLAADYDTRLQARLLRLMRTEDMLAQKLQALASLGVDTRAQRLHECAQTYQREHPQYRYGVKVRAQAWESIVRSAWELSSVVQSLQEWSERLGKA